MGAVGGSVGVRTEPGPAAHLCPPPARAVGTLSRAPSVACSLVGSRTRHARGVQSVEEAVLWFRPVAR